MAYAQRRELISQLEELRHSKVITYVLSDREALPNVPGITTQISSEPQLLFSNLLRGIGKTENLDLFLYTRGGAVDAVWPFVNLLRQFGKKLTVIVPFRAHSAGTLICLGANKVIMSDIAELSPIDPTTGNQFNPSDPTNPKSQFGISVEDVSAYFDLCKLRAGINKEELKLEVLKELTSKVHPLALGNVQRVYTQIRKLARNLLSLHKNGDPSNKNINSIIKKLTEEFYSHVHAISRNEAIALMDDWVCPPSPEEESIILNLFDSYAETLGLIQKFELPLYMGDERVRDLEVFGGFIESSELSYVYRTFLNVSQRSNVPPNVQIQLPPGAELPLLPGFSRSFDYNIREMSWKSNQTGV